ncbi:MAG: hypothetical protein K5778_02005 [Bacteroidaceae bacterium]|nr:hypothetical protein [Bacteroidaceae bacterium]
MKKLFTNVFTLAFIVIAIALTSSCTSSGKSGGGSPDSVDASQYPAAGDEMCDDGSAKSYVVDDDANLYYKPDRNSKIVGHYKEGELVMATNLQNGWCKVWDGDMMVLQGYILADDLSTDDDQDDDQDNDLDDLNEGPSEKVVINSETGAEEGVFVDTDGETYTVMVQDEGQVPCEGREVVVYRAAEGKGWLTAKDYGRFEVRADSEASSEIVGYIQLEEGELPEVYRCLGVDDEWFKIDVNGTVGYIKASLVYWYAINTF